MTNINPKTQQNRAFFASSVISIIASIIGVLLSIGASTNALTTLVPVISNVYWSIWICSVPALYAIFCYINEKIVETKLFSSSVLHVPMWTQLRTFGDQRIARISYWALVLIPVIAYFVSVNPMKVMILENIQLPLSFRLSFFASWFFSIALIVFTVGCPKEFRRQNPLENAKTINLILNDVNSHKLIIDIEQPQEVDDPELDKSALELRATSFLFYVLGLTIALIILFRSAWFVVRA